MKIRIETDDKVDEPEIVIRARSIDSDIVKIQAAILDALTGDCKLTLSRNGRDYFLPPEKILFFESTGGKTFAHTAQNVYTAKQKLYELEEILPNNFIRAGKSVILGTKSILAITRNIAGPSTVQFRGTHKQICVSRAYLKQLINKLNERN